MSYPIKNMSTKARLSVLAFVTDSMDLALMNLMCLAPKAAVFHEIMRNDGHWAVQCHWRSPILVPIESQYVTFCW